MTRLLIATLAAAAAFASQAHAQSLDDVALAAFDGCLAMPSGASIAEAAARLGFTPSALAPDRYIKPIGTRQLQIRVASEPTSGGRSMRTCSVGVYGRLDNDERVTNTLMTRARADGYRVPAGPRPALRGGTEILMGRGSGEAEVGIQFSINPTIDPARGAGTVIVLGWTE